MNLVTERGGDLVEAASAVYSPCRRYRYRLTRRWGDAPAAVFVMLNPSTATAFSLDPTCRRAVAVARREGCGGLVVLNAFALRATDPAALARHPDPVGPANDDVLAEAVAHDGPVVVGWGVHGDLRGRAGAVMGLFAGREVLCLGTTKGGHPRHPLYLRNDAPLIPYGGR